MVVLHSLVEELHVEDRCEERRRIPNGCDGARVDLSSLSEIEGDYGQVLNKQEHKAVEDESSDSWPLDLSFYDVVLTRPPGLSFLFIVLSFEPEIDSTRYDGSGRQVYRREDSNFFIYFLDSHIGQ